MSTLGAARGFEGDTATADRADAGGRLGGRAVEVIRSSAQPAAIFIASRLGLLLVAGALSYVQHTTVRRALTRWDSGWYVLVARAGYPHALPSGTGGAAQSTLGFFPLLPLVIRLLVQATGLSYVRAGLAATFLAGLIAAVLVWWWLYPTEGRRGAGQGTALVFFAPGAFVLSEIYTEGLLIALVAATLLALRRRRWLTAGVFAGLASATEPLGMAVFAPCAIAAFYAIRDRREWRSLIAPLLAPAGVVGFFCFLWVRTGTPLAWFISQRRGWQGGVTGSALFHEISGVVHTGVTYPNFTVKLASFVACVILVVFFLRSPRDAPALGFVAATLLLAFLSPVVGFSFRVLLCAFPLVAVVGARLRTGWFAAVIGFSVLAMSAVAFVSLAGNSLTP